MTTERDGGTYELRQERWRALPQTWRQRLLRRPPILVPDAPLTSGPLPYASSAAEIEARLAAREVDRHDDDDE